MNWGIRILQTLALPLGYGANSKFSLCGIVFQKKRATALFYGASDEARTRYLHLGKVALYQMSYTRNDKKDCTNTLPFCQEKILGLWNIFIPPVPA